MKTKTVSGKVGKSVSETSGSKSLLTHRLTHSPTHPPESLLAHAIRGLTAQTKTLTEWLKSHAAAATKQDLADMEKRMAIKLSAIKAEVAKIKQNNREGLTEISKLLAEQTEKIKALLEGNGDPDVTDEQFETDLKDLSADAQSLADIVAGRAGEETPDDSRRRQ